MHAYTTKRKLKTIRKKSIRAIASKPQKPKPFQHDELRCLSLQFYVRHGAVFSLFMCRICFDAFHQIWFLFGIRKICPFQWKILLLTALLNSMIGSTEEFAYVQWVVVIYSMSKYLILAKVYLIKLNRNDTAMSFFSHLKMENLLQLQYTHNSRCNTCTIKCLSAF